MFPRLFLIASTLLALGACSPAASSDPTPAPSHGAWDPAPRAVVPDLALRALTSAAAAVSLPLDARDLGENFASGSRRADRERGDWRVVTWCPQPVGDTVRVGVITAGEAGDLDDGQRVGVLSNEFRFLLDCPVP